jgi:ribosomal protein S18 acetylase RimI-like enzyme
MCVLDIPSVCSIAMDIWSGYGETPAIYENKIHVSPRGCYVYVVNDSIKGYVISHPWNIRSPPPLNTPLAEVDVNCWFIHDIVVLPECSGRGVGDEMIQRILADHPIVSLVACDDEWRNTKDFWVRYGFEVAESLDCDYGIYMIRKS